MLPWEKGFTFGESGPDFARIWQNLPKVVFSRTLERVEGNATLASQPVADELDRLDGLVAVGGAGLAATLAAQDLIDEYRTFTYPIVLGGGTPYLPHLAGPLALELVESRAIGQIVYQRHRRIRS
jgi:dihydrofolate reductase